MNKFLSYKKSIAAGFIVLSLVSYAYAQDRRTWNGHLTFLQSSPQIRFDGVLAFQTLAGTTIGSVSQTYGGMRTYVVNAPASTVVLTTAQTGGSFINVAVGTTTTFTLPAAATAGLNYCFIEGGDAAGELLVGVATGDNVVGKIHGAENATGIATAASTGIKNTAATNVKGDHTCLVSDGITTWYMYSVAGIWATR